MLQKGFTIFTAEDLENIDHTKKSYLVKKTGEGIINLFSSLSII